MSFTPQRKHILKFAIPKTNSEFGKRGFIKNYKYLSNLFNLYEGTFLITVHWNWSRYQKLFNQLHFLVFQNNLLPDQYIVQFVISVVSFPHNKISSRARLTNSARSRQVHSCQQNFFLWDIFSNSETNKNHKVKGLHNKGCGRFLRARNSPEKPSQSWP